MIKGRYYKICGTHNSVFIGGRNVPILFDCHLNNWIFLDGELIQLRVFDLDGGVCSMPKVLPEFTGTGQLSAGRSLLELDDIDEYWNLNRTAFYMLLTYKLK